MIYDVAKKRRSIRKYKYSKIDPFLIYKIAECGSFYPSRGNKQPLMFYPIQEEQTCRDIFSSILWGSKVSEFKAFANDSFQPSAYILVVVNKSISKAGYEYEIGAAVQNMLLCATEYDLASLWVKSFEKKRIAEILGLEECLEPDSLILLGDADHKSEVVSLSEDISVVVSIEKAMNMEVPKRALEEVIILEK